MKRKLLVMSVVALVLLSSLFILFMHSNEPKVNQGIIIHMNNNYCTILPNEKEYGKLSNECMNILKSINGQYKLGITLDGLKSIKSRENYVEIVFPENITLTTNYTVIKLKGAVFMLSGEYKGKIFTYRGRVVGVWSSDQSFDRLRRMVEAFIR